VRRSIENTNLDARVAVLTPANRGAIAVLGLWGPDALAVADAVFRPVRRPTLSKTRPGVPRLGRVGEGLGDEVVAVVLRLGLETSVEFQSHGGPAASEIVMGALVTAGATTAEPVDWIRRRSASPLRASAWSDLCRAPTARVAEILMDQAEGALDREVETIIESLSDVSREETAGASDALKALIHRAELGVRMIGGWRIVLAGRPNVGKSSILNLLAGYRRSIIDATPGTTRDVVTAALSVDGWPVELADTAGLRTATEELEKIGVERARRVHETADLVLPVLDRSNPLVADDLDLIRRFAGRSPIIANKSDLPPAWDPNDLEDAKDRMIEFSAWDQSGIEVLVSTLGRWIAPAPPSEASGVPWREPHVRILCDARGALATGDRARTVALLSRLLTAHEIE
jgi:tRNA modification GTPase